MIVLLVVSKFLHFHCYFLEKHPSLLRPSFVFVSSGLRSLLSFFPEMVYSPIAIIISCQTNRDSLILFWLILHFLEIYQQWVVSWVGLDSRWPWQWGKVHLWLRMKSPSVDEGSEWVSEVKAKMRHDHNIIGNKLLGQWNSVIWFLLCEE